MATTPDQLVDQAVRHSIHLERYKSGTIKDYNALITKMEKSIVSELGLDITEWNRKRLAKKLSAIRKIIRNTSSDMFEVFGEQVTDLSEYEASFETKSLEKVTVGYDFDLPSSDQIKAAVYSTPMQVTGPYQGSLLSKFTTDWSPHTIQKVNNAIRLGFANGVTTQQLVRALYQSTDGAFALSRKDWNNVVRTGLAHTASVARNETWKKNSAIVKGVRIVATLDGKTTTTCRSLDGQVFPLNKGPRPPFHINCRTTTVASIDERYRFLDDKATRSARDPKTGKVERVSANESYYGWLKTQPVAVQDSVVGPTRGALLRDGGLSSQRFAELQIGKNFEPLTLDEMRKLEPIAFNRADV